MKVNKGTVVNNRHKAGHAKKKKKSQRITVMAPQREQDGMGRKRNFPAVSPDRHTSAR